MKLTHVAALALVGWLLMPPPLRAAGGPIAVPGTADVESWNLMEAPLDFSHGAQFDVAIPFDPTRPLSEWKVTGTFPTEQECLDHRPSNVDDFQCVASDDPRLKEK